MDTHAALLRRAADLGLRRAASSDADIRRTQPRRVRRGVYCVDADRQGGFVESVVAALLVLPPGSLAAGLTAARLWRLDVPAGADQPLEFVVPGARNSAKLAGTALRFERVTAFDLPDGVPSTSQARTIVDLVPRLDFLDGAVLVESALRGDPTIGADLRAEAGRPRSRSANARVSRVLGFAGTLSESALESRARVLWHEAGLPAPRQQAVIRRNGRFVARVDFLWEEVQLVVEVDGLKKYEESGALRDEKRRQNELVSLGYTVLRFTWADIAGRPDQVAAEVLSMIKRK